MAVQKTSPTLTKPNTRARAGMKKSKVEEWLTSHPYRSVETRLAEYEAQYGLSSQEFYTRYMRGEYGDDQDYMGWAGVYQLYLHRNGFTDE